MYKSLLLCLCWLFPAAILPPARGDETRHEIQFPNLPGYQTLRCDFHMHTVFSDGLVWPTVRVTEAWRLGLDLLSLSDHIEYQPHKDDVPTKHGRSHELAVESAKAHDLLLTRAAEITRETPPGHFNALFLDDVRPLEVPDFLEAIKAANGQNAFVFWNHQGWKGAEKGRWLDVHTTMFEKKWFQGMEVANGDVYYPDAHRWCLEKNLTMLGNSDIHEPDLRLRSSADNHRTMTLVFAKERTLEAAREALLARRTVVLYKDQLIGSKDWLEPLFRACVTITPPHVQSEKAVWIKVQNKCAADIQLTRTGDIGPTKLSLPAETVTLLKVAVSGVTGPLALHYTVDNFLVGPETALPVVLPIPNP